MQTKKILKALLTISIVFFMVVSIIPSVSSDGQDRSGGRGIDILLVNDGAQTLGVIKIRNALLAGGYSVYYAPTEASLPASWDDPSIYPSIFWIGGCYHYTTYFWFTDVPTALNTGKITSYVQNGGNFMGCGNAFDYTGHYSGPTEQPYFYNVLYSYCGNLWSGGVGGTPSSAYKTITVSDTSHPLFNDPNTIPPFWTLGWSAATNYAFWYSPSGLLPGGDQVAYSQFANRHAIVVSDAGGGVGRTVLVRHPLEFNWDNTNRGDILTPFMQNIAEWFSQGIPAEVWIEPQALNLDSKGNYVSIKIRGFPENPEYTPFDIDASSVQVQGISIEPKFKKFVDKRFSGKVDRLSFEDAIGAPGKEIEIYVDGQLKDGTTFVGIGTIKAIKHSK
ncbi:MAG: hypothetical protein KAJ51_03025 [Thermoplasmata archaeon]|nr:hypothetical protein [Thermoplasmata archaeon]